MASPTTFAGLRDRYPAVPYIVPFLAILLFIAIRPMGILSPAVEWPLQAIALGALGILLWPPEISKRPRYWVASILVGLAVFCLWIAPEQLIHGYRESILFKNSIVGAAQSSLPPSAQRSAWVLFWRTLRAALMVPIAEELFWRGWLMRWLINNENFRAVRLGTYAPLAFYGTALLFGAEHGPYWDVGLITGILFNLWMIKTKSIADCVLMHGVTNLALSLFVLSTGNWQYWM